MPGAKDEFITRIRNFKNVVSPESASNSVLVSRALTETEHNEKVRMLRNGMAIIGFSILEDFIKERVGEIFKDIGTTPVRFDSLPRKLKEAATVGALKGIQARAELLKRSSENYIGYIQDETKYVSSTKDSVYELSKYSLGWNKSNLSEADISLFLTIFNVNGGWNAIQLISSAISITLPNPKEIFKNAASRRHRAAHNINADSLLIDLQGYVSQASVIAFAFDALITKSLSYIKDNNRSFLTENMKTEPSSLDYRFLLNDGSKWKEIKAGGTRAFRVKNTLAELKDDAIARARTNNEILVIKSDSNDLTDWQIYV